MPGVPSSKSEVAPLESVYLPATVSVPGELPAELADLGQKSFLVIEVTDNGIGFEEKYKDRIFHPFQRLHNRLAYSGTGIGLAICEKVVANHGGAITATSQLGQGATFTIYLPE